MARIVGGICTSHIPAIGNAIARGLEGDPYWQPFFAGYPPVREWLARAQPDVAVMVYNDHGLNFFLDKMPTFAMTTTTTPQVSIHAILRAGPVQNGKAISRKPGPETASNGSDCGSVGMSRCGSVMVRRCLQYAVPGRPAA